MQLFFIFNFITEKEILQCLTQSKKQLKAKSKDERKMFIDATEKEIESLDSFQDVKSFIDKYQISDIVNFTEDDWEGDWGDDQDKFRTELVAAIALEVWST